MSNRSRVVWSIMAGAAVGGALGYLFFTDDGRRLRTKIEPHLDDLVGELKRWRGTLDDVKLAAEEGRRSVSGLVDEFASSARDWSARDRVDGPQH